MTANYLPDEIELPSGVTARIELIPMPQPDSTGRYKPTHDGEIHVDLYRGGRLIERREWNSLIGEEESVELLDGSFLDEDDLSELDSQGWDQMFTVGIVPGKLV